MLNDVDVVRTVYLNIDGGDDGILPGAEHPKHGTRLSRKLYENAANGAELHVVMEDNIIADLARKSAGVTGLRDDDAMVI